MINEWVEFCAYTGTVSYTASKKSDTTWLGRFTFATILEFEGMARILTILARGYLFHGKDGAVISGDPHDRVDHARRALCAWCSVPEDGKRVQGKEWQFQTDFSELHTEFPELVDADGVACPGAPTMAFGRWGLWWPRAWSLPLPRCRPPCPCGGWAATTAAA